MYEGDLPRPLRWLRPIENLNYKIWGVDPHEEMDWKIYAYAVMWSGFISFLVFYGIERLQHLLPLNPSGLGPVPKVD